MSDMVDMTEVIVRLSSITAFREKNKNYISQFGPFSVDEGSSQSR